MTSLFVRSLRSVVGLVIAAGVSAGGTGPTWAADAPPASIFDSGSWKATEGKGGATTFSVGEWNGRPVLTTTSRIFQLHSTGKLEPDTRLRVQMRFANPAARSSLTLAMGLADPADAKDRGKYVTIGGGEKGFSYSIFNPQSTERLPQSSGGYQPQFVVPRSLNWPEALRANVEADMTASKPIAERVLTLDVILREHGYEVSLDGIPMKIVSADGSDGKPNADPGGFARIVMSGAVELLKVTNTPEPKSAGGLFRPVPLESVLNAGTIDGKKLDRASLVAVAGKDSQIDIWGVPFLLSEPDASGNDHVDIGRSWFRQGNLFGRYSGRGTDAMTARWPGAQMKDPARITVRLPMGRYRALHLLAAAAGDRDEVPVITAQFFRPQAGFPKSFAAKVSRFSDTDSFDGGVPVKTADGKPARLFHVTIPIDGGQLAEFDDLDFVDVELTKGVQLYRASPDPMYYSTHAAGLPSSVHLYALTAELPAVDVRLEASNYGHIWTAPEKPQYTVNLANRGGPARSVEIALATTSLDGQRSTTGKQTIKLPAGGETVTTTIDVAPEGYGYHDVQLTINDGEQTQTHRRSLAYLREDTRERGNWDFGRGPLYGFYNWGGGHHTPPNEKQLLVMAKAGIETIQGSLEENLKRGDATKEMIERYKLQTFKFAGGGDHYVTAKFATELKTLGLEKAKENFIATLKQRQSAAGPNNRPIFLSWYPEPSIGPVTHGIFPKFIGEPETPFSEYERERYEMFRNGFIEGAKIVREHFPEVKNLMPHGDPAFVVHFLQLDKEKVAPLLDGVCVDIPCFERLPEQQFHQVSLHRLYMTRKEMTDAGITKPLLPMYEGPCVPSGPGALSDQQQADLTIRNSLILLAYGIDVQNGGFPAFDTASYWGEQHYGFGVLNRVSIETPKIAYTALATMTRHLNRANYVKWIPTGSLNTYCLQFKHYKTGKLVHVMWTLRGKRPATIDAAAGSAVKVYDQNDNEMPLTGANGKVTFTLDPSPCYVTGLSGDAVVALGEPNHGDAKPSEHAKKIGNFGDGSWTISQQTEAEYEESHKPYIFRYPSSMTAVEAYSSAKKGSSREMVVRFPKPEKDRVFVPYYSVIKPVKPIEIPGKAARLGLWVKAHGDWGRVVYFCRDAKGERWINIGTRGQWNCDDLHSWTSFNFDGRRYLTMELPANSPYDKFREQGNPWWGSYSAGDGEIDLPLSLEQVVIERRTHVMYVDDPQPASDGDVRLGDLYAEYDAEADGTPEAVRLAAISMPVPEVKGLANPIAELAASGTGAALKIERITLPAQQADGTQCHVHFPKVEGAKQYDVLASPYADGRGALPVGNAWKEPGGLIRGLRPNTDFYLFVTYTDNEGNVSKPSAPLKINLQDFFGMK
jgi:hypothetical protein